MFDFSNPTFTLTAEQKPIVAHKASDNLIIDAGAGCGKSSTLREYALVRQHLKILAIAYNKRIQESLQLKMPANTTCSTLHSLAHQQCRSLGKSEINSKLELDYLKKHNPDYEKSKLYEMSIMLKTFLAAAPTNIFQFNQIWTTRKLSVPWFTFDQFLMIRSELFRESTISFELMISIFVESKSLRMSQFDEILVDEAQDLDQGLVNMLHRIKLHSPKAKFVFCGDPLQSIYGFKGALPNGMRALKNDLSCLGLPLQTCFRCPANIIDAMKARFSRSKLVPFKKGGVVNSIDYDALHSVIKPGTKCYIARTNAQLMSQSINLIEADIPHSFAASDIGQQMLKLVDMPGFNLEQCRMKAKMFFSKAEDELEDERVDKEITLSVLSGRCDSVDELKSEIRRLFLQPKGKDTLVLSTAHGSKGLEWDTVFIEMAKLGRVRKNASDFEREQEENLLYVSFTRAKQNLFLVR